MRVLLSFPHALGAPGIGWTAWNQVDSLSRAGHQVHVVAASVVRPVSPEVRVTTTLSAGRVRVPHRAIGRERALTWHDSRAAAVLADGEYDVVHLWPLGAGVTARRARSLGVASVREAPNTHTAHAWRVVTEEVESLGLVGEVDTAHTPNAVHLRMEEADWEAATAILAPSDAVSETFRQEGFSEERVIRHQYGYRPGTRRVPPRSSEPVIDGLRAVYVGLGEPRKGLHYALDAWIASEASRTGTFTVVGRMLPAYARVLEDRLSHPSVRVVGFCGDVENALAASDVLVLPTIEEGSALVTYEAQAAGCVPLVSAAAGAMMDDGVHGMLHEPRDVGELTRQLDFLASDRSVLARLSEASIGHSPQLTWDAAGGRLARAYEEAIGIAGGWTDHPSGEVLHAVAG